MAAELPSSSDVENVMKNVSDYALSSDLRDNRCGFHSDDLILMDKRDRKSSAPCGWCHGAFLQGIMASHRVTQIGGYLSYAQDWAENNSWITCNFPKVLSEHSGANDMSCGQTYAELYLLQGTTTGNYNETQIQSISGVLQTLIDRPQIDDWWWVDAYFMAMGAFSRLGHISALKNDTASAHALHLKNFELYNNSAVGRKLFNPESGLYFRDQTYINQTTPGGKAVFWGRGNGWAAGALARTLQYLPKDEVGYDVYTARLQDMAIALKRNQQSDGFWRASILDPSQVPNPETTGTSGMTFGLAWGINAGILDRKEYLPVVAQAWQGLTTIALHQNTGKVGFCQPVGGGPAEATKENTSDFCVGLFLLAAEQVHAMATL